MNTQLLELSYRECEDLLRSGSVGRIALSAPDGPHIVPVNYWTDEGCLIVRTAPYTVLGRYAPGALVAFEVDHLRAEDATGWSVVARGHVSRLADPDELAALRSGVEPESWAPGGRELFLRLEYAQLTGRRISARPAQPRGAYD